MSTKFPEGFLWGAATSPHQIEGNTNNQWAAWEQKHASQLAQAAHTRYAHLQSAGIFPPQAVNTENYISGKGVAHYEMYEQDFQIMSNLNMNAFRFGLEWSRIEPRPGVFNEEELQHYREYILALKKRGIEPFPTLWHWNEPAWFSQMGGFSRSKNIKYFTEYSRRMAEEIGDELKFMLTINEPNVYVNLAYLDKLFPLEKTSKMRAMTTYINLYRAHNKAYDAIKKVRSSISIGLAASIANIKPSRAESKLDNYSASLGDYIWNWWFLDRIGSKLDFVGLNYYHTNYIRGHKMANPHEPLNDLGWYMEPSGIEQVIMRLWQRYSLPIVVTENGLADRRDLNRQWWLGETFAALERVLGKEANVFGYLHWSLLDNFEWKDGWWPKFGLVEVDRSNGMKRTIRPSGVWFGEQIKKLKNTD